MDKKKKDKKIISGENRFDPRRARMGFAQSTREVKKASPAVLTEDFPALLAEIFLENGIVIPRGSGNEDDSPLHGNGTVKPGRPDTEDTDYMVLRNLTNFAAILIETNSLFNLTAIKEPEEIALLHFADSLKISDDIPKGARVLDIGSGAGFPAVPLAVARPDIKVTAIDSTGKKVDFINRAAKQLQLSNLSAVCGRAEELLSTVIAQNHIAGIDRGSFDIVTARAVADLGILYEICFPAVRTGGSFIAMKAEKGREEFSRGSTQFSKLGGNGGTISEYTLKHKDETYSRSLITVTKIEETPEIYPRSYGTIRKIPLF